MGEILIMVGDNRKVYYREDLEYNHSRLTIERQLHIYEKNPDGNERASTLWHAWQQNKRWLIRLLELTLASFPSYSRHDSSHADVVLHNIERVMGEERIALLSATDCFAILHTVYVHDIGMAILAEDREKIVISDGFVEMIEDLVNGADKDLKEAALLLKKNIYYQESNEEIDYDGLTYHEEKKKLYKKKLDTYYAVVQLLAEYQRRGHGEKAASTVKDWILDQDKLRTEFTMSGVPMRIFFRIADCAALHTDWNFQHILDLPWEENGYDNDMLHPRFVAVLLQLGDALDIDNDRFHPFAHAFAGSFPMRSQEHYHKHLAIRTLKITPEEIVIEADCETREAMRLIRNECDWIESLLKSASYYWSSIAPEGFSGALPSFKLSRLLLNGKQIPWDLAMSRFQISQQKAFSLLQGENIYSGYFPFVRELLQNAIDSTKLQCYEDYRTSSKFRIENSREELGKPGITNISKIINPVEYPIEISISCCKLNEEDEYVEISLDQIPEVEKEREKYGVLFSIKDYGTGINTETLHNISDVGTSYKSRKKLLREIPDWLRPTGEFGIGLQSVFLVSDNFFCETYVRNGECYKIEFLTGANGKNGYINVEPKDPTQESMAFGTKFEVFIDHGKKKARTECMDAWTGHDPFSQEYENSQIRRDIIALTIQILLDIDSQLEDLLFPIYVSVKFDLGEEQRELLKSKLTKIVFDNHKKESLTEDNLKKHMCWIYQNANEDNADENIKRFEIEKGVCQVDLTQMKIYLWLNDLAVSTCLGVDFVASDNFQSITSPCKIYYKGILIGERDINKSGNLLEYINIQGRRRGRKLIQLSRNGFTQEGLAYIDTILIPRIYRNLFDVLKTLASQRFASNEKQKQLSFSEKIERNIIDALNNKNTISEKTWQKQLVGISLYYNFYMRELENRNLVYLSKRDESERKQWGYAICNVSAAVCKKRNEVMDMDIHSRLVVIEVYADLSQNSFAVLGRKEITIADFYKKENKFAVVSKRRDTGDKWINTLIWLKNPEDLKDKAPALIEALEGAVTERNKEQGWAHKLEKWADFMLENTYGILESQSIQQSNFVLALLQSVSISACFMDDTGNLKIHILSGQPRGSVYYNIHAKYKLLKHMANRKQAASAERFAGNVWMGYELLQIPMISEDICSIKEQYIQGSETYMIFPCSGYSVQKLIQFAEIPEERYWSQKQMEESEQRELAISLMETKELLRNIAESLYACIVIEYNQVKEANEKLFIEQYVTYCREEKVRTSEMSFWDLLNSGYSLTLGTMLKERRQNKAENQDTWKITFMSPIQMEALKEEIRDWISQEWDNEEQLVQEATVEEQSLQGADAKQQSSPKDEINNLKGKIGKSILCNAEAIIGGRELNGEKGLELLENMKILLDYCLEWERFWNQAEHLQMELETREIKRYFLKSSTENKSLISWVSAQTYNELYGIAECYDRMWDELIGAVLRRRGSGTKDQHFMLLDWMRKEEEHGEIMKNGAI